MEHHLHMRERLEPRAEARRRLPDALRDRTHAAAVEGVQVEDAIGLAEPDRAQHDRLRLVLDRATFECTHGTGLRKLRLGRPKRPQARLRAHLPSQSCSPSPRPTARGLPAAPCRGGRAPDHSHPGARRPRCSSTSTRHVLAAFATSPPTTRARAGVSIRLVDLSRTTPRTTGRSLRVVEAELTRQSDEIHDINPAARVGPHRGRHRRVRPRRRLLIWLFELERRSGRIDRDNAAHAEELIRLRDEFVAVVSHELRTPLTSIIGYLELTHRRATPGALDLRAALVPRDRQRSTQPARRPRRRPAARRGSRARPARARARARSTSPRSPPTPSRPRGPRADARGIVVRLEPGDRRARSRATRRGSRRCSTTSSRTRSSSRRKAGT